MIDRDPIAAARDQWVSHGWSEAADGMALVTSVTRAQQLLVERIEEVLRPHGLTFARYEILRLLAFSRHRSMPMSRLGSLLQVHATSVTSAVTRLEKQGLVERRPHGVDRRIVLASLTATGEALVEEALEALPEEPLGDSGGGNGVGVAGDGDLFHGGSPQSWTRWPGPPARGCRAATTGFPAQYREAPSHHRYLHGRRPQRPAAPAITRERAPPRAARPPGQRRRP